MQMDSCIIRKVDSGEESAHRTCGSAAHGLIVRGCATQRVALKRGAEAPGPRNGRASAATASWPALDSSLEQRRETVRTVLIRDSRFSRSAGFSRDAWL